MSENNNAKFDFNVNKDDMKVDFDQIKSELKDKKKLVKRLYASPTRDNRKGFNIAFAFLSYFINYFNFTGRAKLSEYWWWALINYLLPGAVLIVGAILCFVLLPLGITFLVIYGIYTSLSFIGQLSLTIRRLHDTGKAWPYLFMAIIPIAGPIIILVFMLSPSDNDNRWGLGYKTEPPYDPDDYVQKKPQQSTNPQLNQNANGQAKQQYIPPKVSAAVGAAGAAAGASFNAIKEKVASFKKTPEQNEATSKPQNVIEDFDKTVLINSVTMFVKEKDGERTIDITEFPCILGRDKNHANVVLSDTKVSRSHAQLNYVDGNLVITDLDSANGTFIDGQKIEKTRVVTAEDEVVIGTTLLKFRI